MEKTFTLNSEDEMLAFGANLGHSLPTSAIIFLCGELGAGKTTLTRGLLRGLGYQGKVKSPTYTLVEPYNFSDRTFYHFDLYRLHDPDELEHMGIRDYFADNCVCLIEWPEKGGDRLPKADLSCYIDFMRSGRQVRLVANSKIGEKILQQLA